MSSNFHPKMLPNSLESEQSVLGGLLIHNTKFDDVTLIIGADDFYDAKHKLIFVAIAALLESSQVADINTIKVQLTKNNALDKVGGLSYLLLIIENIPSVDNILHYANHIRELSVYRNLIRVTNEIADLAYAPKDQKVSEILDNAESKIFAISENLAKQQTSLSTIKEIIPKVVEDIELRAESKGKIYGLATGFHKLDELTNGLQKGDLIIVAGRPSMGKTSFAMNIIEHAAIHDKKSCLIFSLEMPKEQLIMRMIASSFRVNMSNMRDGTMNATQWNNFNQAVKVLTEASITIDDSPSLTPNEIRATARRVKKENQDLAVVVVDYIGMVRVPNAKDRNAEISEISRSLKALAKELNVPVIALSQLNRNVENKSPQNKGRMPQMSDLRDSGTLEQDADIVAFVYRDERYHGESGYNNADEIGKADIKIAKHRNGKTAMIQMLFDEEFTKFKNLTNRNLSEHEEQSYVDDMNNLGYSQSIDPNEEINDQDRPPF